MNFRSMLAVAALVLVSGQALAQNQAPASYDPRNPAERPVVQQQVPPAQVPPTAQQQPDPGIAAQQRFAAWQQTKIACYRAAGLTDRDYRVSPTNPDVLQIADRIWRSPPATVNLNALRACQ